ncbi:MAG TPA: carboxypeptidase-like regulatory domain-containing protein, partial [Blastocatellia bacterium]|nr:carboxypeptidase-like regulatory domain-containing protein [Blastocatellia bacterium]
MRSKFSAKYGRRMRVLLWLLVGLLIVPVLVAAQQTTGNVRGTVKDDTGAVIPKAKVDILDKATNNRWTAQSGAAGDFEFKDLPVGNYQVSISATGFKTVTLSDVAVQLNQTTDLAPTLPLGAITETVNVSAGGSELVDTSTSTLAKGFDARQVADLPQSSQNTVVSGISGVYNLALLAPNVESSGGAGIGVGGSVGGQRTRNNDFVLDGVDDNRKDVTGPLVYVSTEAVAQFSLLSNYYPAEFAHSTGGQFIAVTKSGSNLFHGSAFGFFSNKHFNALDTLLKDNGTTRATYPRFDEGRFGGDLGGPIIKDKLFFFGLFERSQNGQATGAGGILAPTAAGF